MVEIDGWMLSVIESPCECAQSTNRCGSGNSVVSHSQPSQLYGWPGAPATVAAAAAPTGLLSRLKSVSIESVSSGTWFARNCAIRVW